MRSAPSCPPSSTRARPRFPLAGNGSRTTHPQETVNAEAPHTCVFPVGNQPADNGMVEDINDMPSRVHSHKFFKWAVVKPAIVRTASRQARRSSVFVPILRYPSIYTSIPAEPIIIIDSSDDGGIAREKP